MPENNDKKRWGRRLFVGLLAFAHIDVFYFHGATKGILEHSYKWALLAVGIALFIGGYLTATDIMDRYKK